MHKTELVNAVAESANITKEKAHDIISTILDEITNALSRNESVNILGFGSFNPKTRAARTGRSPATGEPIEITASNSVSFKPGKQLKDLVNQASS
ncbi:HU family DNA-binding protein [Sessilibacter sp. MAH1]